MNGKELKRMFFIFLLITYYLSLVTIARAEVLERVVAIVNDKVILLSEFREALQSAKDAGSGLTDIEVLDNLIDRILLLEQAERFGLKDTAVSRTPLVENTIINEYINRRIKAFIRIPANDIETYYNKHKELFGNKNLYDVKDEIESQLITEELNARLHEHIEELRKKSYIRIQLEN